MGENEERDTLGVGATEMDQQRLIKYMVGNLVGLSLNVTHVTRILKFSHWLRLFVVDT